MNRALVVTATISFLTFAGCGDDEASSGDAGTGANGFGASGSGASGQGANGTGNAGTGNTGTGNGGPGGAGYGDCDGLSEWEQMMLDKHNEWRASVTPAAADMYRVYWDVEIAANAAAWVSSCDPDWPHSPEEERTGIGGYDVLGENLSYCAGTGCSELPMVTDNSGLGDGEGWWDEHVDYNWADDSSSGVTAHYTQMVSSNVYAIGCATQLCGAPGPFGWDGDWWWTICQYGPRGQAYWVGNKPYEAGEGGLVEPPGNVFDDHPGLCSGQ